MLTEYTEPKTATEMLERYAAIRRRCFSPNVAIKPKQKPYVLRNENAHVVAYRIEMHRREMEQASEKAVAAYREIPIRENKTPVDKIMREVAEKHGVTVAELKGKGRYRRLTVPRHEAMARIYKERPDLSLPTIGRLMGGRDHTTVLHAVQKMGVHDARPPSRFART